MPWAHTPEDRARDRARYDAPEYKRNRAVAWRRAAGRCEQIEAGQRCGSTRGCQVDHIVNLAAGGTHNLDNLRVLCGFHHKAKTALEGGGYRASGEADPDLQTRTSW